MHRSKPLKVGWTCLVPARIALVNCCPVFSYQDHNLNSEVLDEIVEQTLIDTLILANVDFNTVEDIKLFRFIDSQVCATFQILLSLYSHVENQFLRIINNKGERAILYTKHGIIYIPECTEIKTIHIQEGENCYKEIPITFVHQNEELSGFLNKDYII